MTDAQRRDHQQRDEGTAPALARPRSSAPVTAPSAILAATRRPRDELRCCARSAAARRAVASRERDVTATISASNSIKPRQRQARSTATDSSRADQPARARSPRPPCSLRRREQAAASRAMKQHQRAFRLAIQRRQERLARRHHDNRGRSRRRGRIANDNTAIASMVACSARGRRGSLAIAPRRRQCDAARRQHRGTRPTRAPVATMKRAQRPARPPLVRDTRIRARATPHDNSRSRARTRRTRVAAMRRREAFQHRHGDQRERTQGTRARDPEQRRRHTAPTWSRRQIRAARSQTVRRRADRFTGTKASPTPPCHSDAQHSTTSWGSSATRARRTPRRWRWQRSSGTKRAPHKAKYSDRRNAATASRTPRATRMPPRSTCDRLRHRVLSVRTELGDRRPTLEQNDVGTHTMPRSGRSAEQHVGVPARARPADRAPWFVRSNAGLPALVVVEDQATVRKLPSGTASAIRTLDAETSHRTACRLRSNGSIGPPRLPDAHVPTAHLCPHRIAVERDRRTSSAMTVDEARHARLVPRCCHPASASGSIRCPLARSAPAFACRRRSAGQGHRFTAAAAGGACQRERQAPTAPGAPPSRGVAGCRAPAQVGEEGDVGVVGLLRRQRDAVGERLLATDSRRSWYCS